MLIKLMVIITCIHVCIHNIHMYQITVVDLKLS